jgi:hypothetical protein
MQSCVPYAIILKVSCASILVSPMPDTVFTELVKERKKAKKLKKLL